MSPTVFLLGYLLTTFMYWNNIGQWIPVQLSWIQGLSEDYYTIHFSVLFQQFLIPSILPDKHKKLATSIIDFLQAQQKGFVAAYSKVFGQTNPEAALSKPKGCRENFRQLVTRVKRNCAVIRAEEEVCNSSLFIIHIILDNVIFTLQKIKIFTPCR